MAITARIERSSACSRRSSSMCRPTVPRQRPSPPFDHIPRRRAPTAGDMRRMAEVQGERPRAERALMDEPSEKLTKAQISFLQLVVRQGQAERIPKIFLLLSPTTTHESDGVGQENLSDANGGKSVAVPRPPFHGKGPGRSAPAPTGDVGAGTGSGWLQPGAARPPGGLPLTVSCLAAWRPPSGRRDDTISHPV